jgi:o-succinylbenzoate synthase
MLQASFTKYPLSFKRPSGTSRGVLTEKTCYFIKVFQKDSPEVFGLGEISIIEGLSKDNPDHLEERMNWVCQNINESVDTLNHALLDFPAIRMGVEMAFLDLKSGGKRVYFNSHFTRGMQPININGLIWMGDTSFMLEQIKGKITDGFSCLKLKIGANNFEDEIEVIQNIRKEYDEHNLEIRVDANGAFSPSEALEKLNRLEALQLHSIEQPIKQGQWEEMAKLCEATELPIALDEELIGTYDPESMTRMLEKLSPAYIILKPSLLGGFNATYQWIQAAGEMSIPWWITSALESNVGLAAIAQFTGQFYNPLPQGLGTGQLYNANVDCPLQLEGQMLSYHQDHNWDLASIKW